MGACVFCRIGQGHEGFIYEDEGFFAVLDVRPRTAGHTLVIPKEHSRWVWDVPDIGAYFAAVQRVANALRSALNTEVVQMAVMGEEIPHAHVHLIPRFAGDPHGAGLNMGPPQPFTPEQTAEIAARIRDVMG